MKKQQSLDSKTQALEGELRRNCGFMRGYKPCILKIQGKSLYIQDGPLKQNKFFKIDLNEKVSIDPNQKDLSDFLLIAYHNKKHKKFYLKAKDPKEQNKWVKEILKAINSKGGESSDGVQSGSGQSSCNISQHNFTQADFFINNPFTEDKALEIKLQEFNASEKKYKKQLQALHDITENTQSLKEQPQLKSTVEQLIIMSNNMIESIRLVVKEVDIQKQLIISAQQSSYKNKVQYFSEGQSKNSKGEVNEQKYSKNQNNNKPQYQIKEKRQTVNDIEEEEKIGEYQKIDHYQQYNDEEEKFKDYNYFQKNEEYEQEMNSISDETEQYLDAVSTNSFVHHDLQIVSSKKCYIQDVYEERITLPYLRPPDYKVSLWRVFKDLIGKDLSRFSMPIYFNEPLSMLQKTAETCQFSDLFEETSQIEDSLLKLAYVSTCFCIRYATQEGRTTKPFNPLLGETYELVSDKYRFFSEQVSHHPPICSFHMQSQNYEVFNQIRANFKFNGRYLYFQPLGSSFMRFKLKDGTSELYACDSPLTSAHNILIGQFYTDSYGKIIIKNYRTGDYCDFEYFSRGRNNKDIYKVKGVVRNSAGEPFYEVTGKYTESITITNLQTGEAKEVWKAAEKPAQWDHLYHFSKFALQLNYLPKILIDKLPPTDSRFRPDQKCIEEGQMEEGVRQKQRLEDAQRIRRKQMEENGIVYKPIYFEEQIVEETGESLYVFNGKYWEDRANRDWSKLARIYD